MTEPSRKKQKGRVSPTLTLVEHRAIGDKKLNDIHWWTSHELRPGEFNLTEFETGISQEMAARRNIRVPFSGRPSLILELAPYIRVMHSDSPVATVNKVVHGLRSWWRIFDTCESIAPVTTLADLNDIHNAAFLRSGRRIEDWKAFMAIVRVAREDIGLTKLYWTSPERIVKTKDLVEQRDVSLIYHHLKRQAFTALLRYENDTDSLPTKREIQHFFTLYLLRTGWNPQTALDIDTSLDESGELSCIRPHPTSPTHHIVISKKARAGGSEQYALGANKVQLSCGNIIRSLHRQSTSLREKLRKELAEITMALQSQSLGGAEAQELELKVKKLNVMIRSPWLFSSNHVRGRNSNSLIGDISILTSFSYQDAGTLGLMKGLIRDVNSSLREGEKLVSDIVLTDFRDAYIEAQYQRSGYSWIAAMLAAQHTSVETLRAYLNKRQYKAYSEKKFLDVTNEVWCNVENLRGVDPAGIAAKLAGATKEQLERWQAGKDRTRMGMGCKDFYHPPKSLVPEHNPGNGCRVQRCVLCEHGIIFTDSIVHLARRMAELLYLETHMSMLSWRESTFPEEAERLDSVLNENFEITLIKKWLCHWKNEIAEKRHKPLMLEGSYE